jgi:hypothetical protein
MFIHMVVIFNNKHYGKNDISQHYNITYILVSRLGYVLLQEKAEGIFRNLLITLTFCYKF